MQNKKVIVIPKAEPITLQPDGKIKKKRACAYARVSTDFEDQRNSFNAQMHEFKMRIERNPDWEFVGLYSDEGISGTNLKKREGFRRMIADAMDGKIDLILVKSISRFARNTIDFLGKVRELKEKNVEVFFEKENLSSLDDKCEIMLTMFACFAQEESRQISTNVTWGVRKRMADGQRKINPNTLLGYKSDGQGGIIIDEDTAIHVREIYQFFIAGYTYREIARIMESRGVATTTGGTKWTVNNVYAVLSNEKYCGDMLCQKTYTPNFLDHNHKRNDGQVAKYMTIGHHEGIIDRETFAYVQSLRNIQASKGTDRNHSNGPLGSMVICECCRRPMRSVIAHKGKPYERKMLTCKNKKGDCDLVSTIPFAPLMKVIERIVGSSVDYEGLKKRVTETIIDKRRMDHYCQITEKVKDLISEKEHSLKELIKHQISSGKTLADFNDEYQRIANEIKKLKEELASIERQEFEGRDSIVLDRKMLDYLKEETPLTNDIIRRFIFKVISRGNRTVRIILNDGSISEDGFNVGFAKLMEASPIDSGVEKENGDYVIYEIINPEGIL